MTIKQSATFLGTEHADVRPAAYSKTAVLDGIIGDQAYLFERTTNLPVPDAPSAAVVGHDHSGNGDGAIIRIPWCNQLMQASLPRRAAAPISGGTDYAAFSNLIAMPFYCPPGVDQVQCVLWVDSATVTERGSFRAVCQDASFTQIGEWASASVVSHIESGVADTGLRGLSFTVDSNQGAPCVLIVQAWDGAFSESVPANENGELLGDRFVYGMTFGPVLKKPNQQLLAFQETSNQPRSLLDLTGDFVSFDSALISDDLGVSSYHLTNLAKNDGVISELATGIPAGTESSISVDGHNHADGASVSAPPGVGSEISRTLGSWSYGTVRPPVNDGTSSFNYDYDDVIGTGSFSNIWYGGVNAIALLNSANTSWQIVAKHLVRIPASVAANLSSGTGKLTLVSLVNFNAAKATRLDIRASLGDENDLNYGATSIGSSLANGRDLVYCTAIPATSIPAGEQICTIKIEMLNNKKAAAASFLLGAALYYEA